MPRTSQWSHFCNCLHQQCTVFHLRRGKCIYQSLAYIFLPCCADKFPPCSPSHTRHLIAFKKENNNQHRAPVVSQRTTNMNWSSLKGCVNLQRGVFSVKPTITITFTIPAVFLEENGFLVLPFRFPATGSDSIDSHNCIRWLLSFSKQLYSYRLVHGARACQIKEVQLKRKGFKKCKSKINGWTDQWTNRRAQSVISTVVIERMELKGMGKLYRSCNCICIQLHSSFGVFPHRSR